jgi:tetratricopeptide (TPR) repeat protein
METDMAQTSTDLVVANDKRENLSARVSSLALASLPAQTQGLLMRMFADPYLLEKEQRAELVADLRACVSQYPQVSELRVLLGMALCVNFDPQAAIEELRESVRLAPNSFIAQLKLGELWMRLRVRDQAEEHTRIAALLAQNMAQADLARKQAATLRTMKREGIERGGYKSPWAVPISFLRRFWTRQTSQAIVTADIQ